MGRKINNHSNEIKLKNNSDLAANVSTDNFLKKIKIKIKLNPHSNKQMHNKTYAINLSKIHRKFFSLYPVTREEVNSYLKSLETNSTWIWWNSTKTAATHCTLHWYPLTHIINLCFQERCFPDTLKIAKVIPIFKYGDDNDKNNDRPISNLSSISKMFERYIAHRFKGFL